MVSLVTHVAGIVQNADTLRTISYVNQIREAGGTSSRLLKFILSTNNNSTFSFDVSKISLAFRNQNLPMIATIAEQGDTTLSSPSGDINIIMQNETVHPRLYGPIRDLMYSHIDDSFVAVGMDRQVYKLRPDEQNWKLFDFGIHHPKDPTDVCGFNSICITQTGTYYAVGFGGEVWCKKEKEWNQIESATNLVLHCVASGVEDEVYVFGQNGVILRVVSDITEVIDSPVDSDIWGGVTYKGETYFCTEQYLYKISGNQISAVKTGFEQYTFRSVHCCPDLIALFGPEEVLYSSDGVNWNKVLF